MLKITKKNRRQLNKLQRNSEQVCGVNLKYFHLAVLAAPPRLELTFVHLIVLSPCALLFHYGKWEM